MAKQYLKTSKSDGYAEANRELGRFHKRLTLGKSFKGIFVDSSHDEIKTFAEDKSRNLERLFLSNSKKHGFDWALRLIVRRVADCNLEFPVKSESPAREELLAALARVFDPQWWRRQIKNRQDLILEQIQIELGKVHKQAGIYASDQCVTRKLQDWKRSEEILASLEAENDLGQIFNLLDLAQKGVSNLINRRNELMTRIAGLEAFAKDQGHQAVFITITAPSRYHSHHANPCRPNNKYEGFSPRETHAYLNTVWQRIRAKWNRQDIIPYGFRVVEPHHDGTPHWHLLLFIQPEKVKRLVEITREYALAESPNEKGAQQRRVTVENIDPNKGSAAGYIAKYIAKNIDGEHLGEDLYGRDAIESATRIRAWASNWKIRQFQPIGGPSVTAWRELRKLKSDDALETILANINLDDFN
ncbi:MAG: replication endonuclease, partial [Pseudomonadota bacterium]|nr:replication endonuclease [Pseudomonadota bacterium]